MTKTSWVWLIIGMIYAAFFGWYTSFGGPLTNEEIDHYLSQLQSLIHISEPTRPY